MKKKNFVLFIFLVSTAQISLAQHCTTEGCSKKTVENELYCYTCGNALPAEERKNPEAARKYKVRERLDNISESLKRTFQAGPALLKHQTRTHVITGEYIRSSPAEAPPLLNPEFTRDLYRYNRERSVRFERPALEGCQTFVPRSCVARSCAPRGSQFSNEWDVITAVDRQESLDALNLSLSLYQGEVKLHRLFPDFNSSPAKAVQKWAVMVFWLLNNEDPEHLMISTRVINEQVRINSMGDFDLGMPSPEKLISYWQQNDESQGTSMILSEHADFSEFANESFNFVIYMEKIKNNLIIGYYKSRTLWFLSPKLGLISIRLGESDLNNRIINDQFRRLLATLLGLRFERHVLRLLKEPD